MSCEDVRACHVRTSEPGRQDMSCEGVRACHVRVLGHVM